LIEGEYEVIIPAASKFESIDVKTNYTDPDSGEYFEYAFWLKEIDE